MNSLARVMDGYLGNFIEHGGQIVSLAAVATLWLTFSAIGAMAGGKGRVQEATPLFGWAVVSFVFTVGGVFTSVPFTYFAIGSAGLAIVGAILALRRGDRIVAPGSFKIAALCLPLLVLVSAMVGSQWDEFSQWLIGPRQVLELDSFPDRTTIHLGASHPDYPFGWQLVTYLTSRLAGRLVENAGALFNVFLLLSFGLVVVQLIREALGRSESLTNANWALYAIGALSVTLFNPTFAQKVVLTSYADVATAVCVGFGSILGWRMLGAIADGRRRDVHHLAWQIGLIMLVLVNLKQATLVLFVLVVCAILLAGLRDPEVRNGEIVKTVPAMVLPGVVVYFAWRHHIETELMKTVMFVRPVDQWLIDLIPQIVWKMLIVLSKKGAYAGLMFVATVLAVRGMIGLRTPFDRLTIIIAAVFLGYNAFLLFAYVTIFSERDALRAVSLWRYNMHLGPLAVAFAAYGLARLWRTYGEARFDPARLRWLPVVLVVAAPLVFAPKLRFDKHPPVPHFRAVGGDVAAMVKPGDRLFVFDPKGSGESAMITRFELHDTAVYRGYHGAFHPATVERFRSIFGERDLTHVLVHSWTPVTLRVLGLDLAAERSYLLRSEDGGGWTVERSWKTP